MANCYIFGFGGSGARVIESFVFLLGSASATRNPDYAFLAGYTFVPILVDLDQTNGNKTKTTDLLRLYQKIGWKGADGKGNFFGLPIKSINEVCSLSGPLDNFDLGIRMDNQGSLAEVIDYENSDVDDRALSDLLFKTNRSKEKDLLNMSLSKGFKGGPHVGSVVMSKLSDEESVRNFCNKLNADDRIVLIASAFGGTGAAGAPLFARMLRDAPESVLPKQNVRKNVQISLVSVLPYFSLTDDKEGMVKPNSFMIKTKAALTFYTNHKDFSHIYYVGTKGLTTQYPYSEGGSTQENQSHLVELIGAMSIFEFLKITKDNATWDGRLQGWDYGLNQDLSTVFNLPSLDPATSGLFLDNWIAFHFAGKYCKANLPKGFSSQNGFVDGLKLGNFGVSAFFISYNDFWTRYFVWLDELSNKGQDPSFVPFSMNAVKGKDIYEGINGFNSFKLGFFDADNLFGIIETSLNEQAKNISKAMTNEQLFLQFMTLATKKALKKYENKYPLKVLLD